MLNAKAITDLEIRAEIKEPFACTKTIAKSVEDVLRKTSVYWRRETIHEAGIDGRVRLRHLFIEDTKEKKSINRLVRGKLPGRGYPQRRQWQEKMKNTRLEDLIMIKENRNNENSNAAMDDKYTVERPMRKSNGAELVGGEKRRQEDDEERPSKTCWTILNDRNGRWRPPRVIDSKRKAKTVKAACIAKVQNFRWKWTSSNRAVVPPRSATT